MEDKNNFRNLAYTVCTQNESRRQDFIEKYDNDDDSNNSFKVHFSKFLLNKESIILPLQLYILIFLDYNLLLIIR